MSDTRRITRIAPTPSGFLHVGNCVNFVIVAHIAQRVGAHIALRIDDMDRERYRREYVDDIFRVLDWLEITPDIGPATTTEFEAGYSMQDRHDGYRSELQAAIDRGLQVYVCSCSRKMLQSGQPCTCRDRDQLLEPGKTALRIAVAPGTRVAVGDVSVDVASEMGDWIVWRREGLASYHLASLIEDRNLGTTDIVRGEDLLASTAAQMLLAPYVLATGFQEASFRHHRLVRGVAGEKLSKSQLGAQPLARTVAERDRIRRLAEEALPMEPA